MSRGIDTWFTWREVLVFQMSRKETASKVLISYQY